MPSDSCPLFDAPFWFLRHGETEHNRLALTAGKTDVPLNETGWQQARAAAELLKGRGVTALYASPMRRTLDSAQCVADALNLPIVLLPEIVERDWGEMEGKPREMRIEIEKPPGGESQEEFVRRTLAGLAKVPSGGLPLIVAHSGTFRVLRVHFGIPALPGPVENSRPIRFVPPAGQSSAWIAESL